MVSCDVHFRCWRQQYDYSGWLVGRVGTARVLSDGSVQVNTSGQFTGADIAYIYPDLRMAMKVVTGIQSSQTIACSGHF